MVAELIFSVFVSIKSIHFQEMRIGLAAGRCWSEFILLRSVSISPPIVWNIRQIDWMGNNEVYSFGRNVHRC